MKLLRTVSRILVAISFSALLIAAYLFSRDTVLPMIYYKIIQPLNMSPDRYTPWLDVVSAIVRTFALMPPAAFCAAVFGYFYRSRTAFWAILPVSGMLAYFLLSLRSHWFFWTEHYAHAFLSLSFIVFSMLAAKLYRKLPVDGERTMGKQRKVFISTVLVAIAVAVWLHFGYSLLGTRVSGKEFEGIILSRQVVEDIGRHGASSWWAIRPGDIKILEARLQSYVTNHPEAFGPHVQNELSSYRRWYHSELSPDGNRQINVFLMHGSQVSRPQWLHVFFGMAGGGDYFCDMTYNVMDGSFENGRCNADT